MDQKLLQYLLTGDYASLAICLVITVIFFLASSLWRLASAMFKKEQTVLATDLSALKTGIAGNTNEITLVNRRVDDLQFKHASLEQSHTNAKERIDKIEVKLESISTQMNLGFTDIRNILLEHLKGK